MASAVVLGSTLNLSLNPPYRGRRQNQFDVSAIVRRSRRPWGFPSLVLARRRKTSFSRAAQGDGGSVEINQSPPAIRTDTEEVNNSASSGDGYVALLVQTLGLHNDPLDREQAVITLWKYSDGGKECVDSIMKYPGCVSLILSLLKSDSPYACEAGTGLLRNISSISFYRDILAESGVIEEIDWLLRQDSLTEEAKVQGLCTLWNLSIEEKTRIKIGHGDLLPLLIKFLDDEAINIKEAAVGIMANLTLSPSYHIAMVEAGAIGKLADLFKCNAKDFKVIRKAAKMALLELSKDDYYRVLIFEEGLIRVPLVGAAAYKSFRPQLHSRPTLPDGTEFELTSRPSKFGATELLLGLSFREKNFNLEESKSNAIIAQSQQHFLAQIGAIEIEDQRSSELGSSMKQHHTLLPLLDGIARLVLILGLEDASAISRAAQSIADASISEHSRKSFKDAGAIKGLVQLLSHDDDTVQENVAYAIDRLCQSYEVRQTFEAEGIVHPLVNIVKNRNASESLLEKVLNIMHRILDPGKADLEDKVISLYDGDALAKTLETSSTELTSWEMAMDSDAVKHLIRILKMASVRLQSKTACVLDYLSNFEPYANMIIASDIESGLDAVFQTKLLHGTLDVPDNQPELRIYKAEEIGVLISAAAKLLTKLLNFEQFHHKVDAKRFGHALRIFLRSTIPLQCKNWVAACLTKLGSKATSTLDIDYPSLDMEITLYETIPRLVEQLRMSFSLESKEVAAIELNSAISKGGMEFSKAIAAAGGIFPIVKLIEESTENNVLEACLSILDNLCMDDENHPAMLSAGAVPALKRIVRSEGRHWSRALHLLRTLPT